MFILKVRIMIPEHVKSTSGTSSLVPWLTGLDADRLHSATGNNTLVEYNLLSGTSAVILLDGISGNDSYLLSGVDYSKATQTIFVSANARAAFYTNGKDLTGPNHLLQYDPVSQSVIRDIDFSTIISQIEDELGAKIGGFQDQAEDRWGNVYYMATWGNTIIKVTPSNELYLFYAPLPVQLNTSTPGFGGLAITQDLLVVTDAISASFLLFNLTDPNPIAKYLDPSDVPNWYSPLLCDSLVIPSRYKDTIALCADDFVNGVGGIAVYQSYDKWAKVKFLGISFNDRQQVPNGTATATFEAGGSIFSVYTYIPDTQGIQPVSNYFPMVDITDQIDAIVTGQNITSAKM